MRRIATEVSSPLLFQCELQTWIDFVTTDNQHLQLDWLSMGRDENKRRHERPERNTALNWEDEERLRARVFYRTVREEINRELAPMFGFRPTRVFRVLGVLMIPVTVIAAMTGGTLWFAIIICLVCLVLGFSIRD